MTDCPRGDIRDLLPDLVHDQLAPEVRAGVEAHVAACAACAAEVALLRRMRAALGRTPSIDVGRIAAAVRAARADDAGVPDTVPVAAIPATRAGHAPAAVRPRAAGRRVLWSDWRAAAGIAAVAVGVMSYSLARSINGRTGAPELAPPSAPESAAAATPSGGETPAPSGSASSGASTEPRPAPPRSTTPVGASRNAARVDNGLSFDGGVSDLPDAEVRALMESLDQLDAVPDAEPAPIATPILPADSVGAD